jgi:DNA gyrase/topoisomerase IV subunit A
MPGDPEKVLRKLRERESILQATFKAQQNWEQTLRIISSTDDDYAALAALVNEMDFDGAQARAVLDLTFTQLVRANRTSVRERLAKTRLEISRLTEGEPQT